VEYIATKVPRSGGDYVHLYIFYMRWRLISTIPLQSPDERGGSIELKKHKDGEQEDVMSLSATLKIESADQDTVRYVDSYGGGDAFLAGSVAIKASDLPDPPPALLRISFAWYQAPATAGTGSAGAEATPARGHAKSKKIAQGDRVQVVKSKVSGVKSPPEWLEQYVGRTGIVLWTTADGAMVDLNADTAWFSYEELNSKD
jgi:hypothetical protein